MSAKMKSILIFLFSLHLIMHGAFCILRNCTQEVDANKVCKNGISQNHPIELNTTVYLREIVKINEEENSITVQMTVYNNWIDPSLTSSNTTES